MRRAAYNHIMDIMDAAMDATAIIEAPLLPALPVIRGGLRPIHCVLGYVQQVIGHE